MSATLSFTFIRRAINRRFNRPEDRWEPYCTAVWRRDLAKSITIRHQRGEISAGMFARYWKRP